MLSYIFLKFMISFILLFNIDPTEKFKLEKLSV